MPFLVREFQFWCKYLLQMTCRKRNRKCAAPPLTPDRPAGQGGGVAEEMGTPNGVVQTPRRRLIPQTQNPITRLCGNHTEVRVEGTSDSVVKVCWSAVCSNFLMIFYPFQSHYYVPNEDVGASGSGQDAPVATDKPDSPIEDEPTAQEQTRPTTSVGTSVPVSLEETGPETARDQRVRQCANCLLIRTLSDQVLCCLCSRNICTRAHLSLQWCVLGRVCVCPLGMSLVRTNQLKNNLLWL